jgi:hypothetical protein
MENNDKEFFDTASDYESVIAELNSELATLRKLDCAQSQRAGEEAIVKMAIERFTQVVDLIAKDYWNPDKIKKAMWAQFRGLPDKKDAWNLVINPYAVKS